MSKARMLFIMVLAIAAASFSEPTVRNGIAVERLYLKYRADGVHYDGQSGFSIIKHPYFGYDSIHVAERVGYFGRNLAKEMESVPKAHSLMNGYMLHRIGLFVGLLAGAGIIAYTINDEVSSGSNRNEDGTYSTKMPMGFKVGLGCIGLGLALEFTKPLYLYAAMNEYNKYARR